MRMGESPWGVCLSLLALFGAACSSLACARSTDPGAPPPLMPVLVTEPVKHDSDDPAIWIHPDEPARSLVLGTDKHEDGALYAFDLDGRVVATVPGLRRPNNVDVAYGIPLGDSRVDVAMATERHAHRLRAFRLPGLEPVDGGGIEAFEGETQREPMGVALYKRPRDGALYAIVSRKTGPSGSYLWQYRLRAEGGVLRGTKERAFGAFGGGEIEAIAVDAELGYVYYSDESVGGRKYAADPDAPDAGRELTLLGTSGFQQDREGISIYKLDDGTGYILVSDQQANRFHVFPREGLPGRPHEHPLLKVTRLSTLESDGSDVTSAALPPRFPHGLFVAMSEGGVFHYYAWPDLAGSELRLTGVSRASALAQR